MIKVQDVLRVGYYRAMQQFQSSLASGVTFWRDMLPAMTIPPSDGFGPLQTPESSFSVVISASDQTSSVTSLVEASTVVELSLTVQTLSSPLSVPQSLTPQTSSTSLSTPSSSDYSSIAIRHHNAHRSNHSAGEVTWDDGLAGAAALVAGNCIFAHNTTAQSKELGAYGQNIAAGLAENNISGVITELFYNGEVSEYHDQYGKNQPDMNDINKWGHFTQLVWGHTSHIGCATVYCPGGLSNVGSDVPPYITVCNYQAEGNIDNEYTQVGLPLGHAELHWNS